MVTFISTLVSILGTNFFTSLFKRFVDKYGDSGVHLIVLLLSIIASSIMLVLRQYPSTLETLKTMLLQVAEIFSGAIALYEVAWKKFDPIIKPIDVAVDNMSS